MSGIREQLLEIRHRIATACRESNRDLGDVFLIAVSKTFPAESIREAMAEAQLCFGESRLQEAAPKIESLPTNLEWHFIGAVQRNKVRKILPLFPWIHAVDSLKLARYLDTVAGELGLMPNIFLQVNQAGEASKGGFSEKHLEDAIEEICSLPNLKVAGLMTIPPDDGSPAVWFRNLRLFRDRLESGWNVSLQSLSMGMSGDFEEAIQEGATHIRVGSSIFGDRVGKIEGELG